MNPHLKACEISVSDLENSSLADLAKKAGYASLNSMLNDLHMWGDEVGTVEKFLKDMTGAESPASSASKAVLHTPGPWSIHDHKGQFQVLGKDGWIVARAFGDSSTETNANARLIASAPELLAALERLLSPTGMSNTVAHIYESLADRDQDTIDSYEADFMQAVEQSRAAVAKATS